MVLYLLYMKAELENVESVQLPSDAMLCFNVRNPLSDYEVRDKVEITLNETVAQDESDRTPPHHLALKWDGAKKVSTLTVLDAAAAKTALKKKKGVPVPGPYMADADGDFAPILAVECRGMEPYGGIVGGNFAVTSTNGGPTFAGDDVNLVEGDWADYDEENDAAVSLSDIVFKWEAV
jgi:hypothetical protein